MVTDGRCEVGTFKTYRGAGELEIRIKMAVAMFYKSWGVLPAAIVVNKRELDGARVAAGTLGLGVPVGSIGGCLVPEVWLEVGKVR
jgi:hypothetical protein